MNIIVELLKKINSIRISLSRNFYDIPLRDKLQMFKIMKQIEEEIDKIKFVMRNDSELNDVLKKEREDV
jgi:succinylglutamate desuccinylase